MLASRAWTPVLTLAYATLLVLLAGWGVRSPAPVVASIARLAPFGALYALAAAHLLACLVLSWPAIRQRISLAPPEAERDLGRTLTPAEVAAGARAARLRVRWLAPDRAALFRNRFSPLGTVALHAALLLLPAAFVLSRATRFRGDAWIVEGHRFDGSREAYVHVEPEAEFARRAPDVRFEVERVAATFWGRRLFFTDLRARVRPDGGAPAWMTLASPLALGGARVSLHGFNLTPSVEVTRADGTPVESADLHLRLFPPGTTDSFRLPSLPHRFFVTLRDEAGGYAAARPRLHVTVTRLKRIVARGWLRPGEALPFDGHRIAFPSLLRGGEIMVHRDLGYPVLWAALLLAVGGAAARVLSPSTRAWVWLAPEGARVAVREDAFGGRAAALARAWRIDAG